MDRISCHGGTVTIEVLTVSDPGLAELLSCQPEDSWSELIERVLVIGARGLLTMGLGIDLAEVDARVRHSVEEVTAEAARHAEAVLAAARQAFSEHLDPEHRSSVLARALSDLAALQDGFLARFDPSFADSHTARFLSELHQLLGPHGMLETRLSEALDPEADGSALSGLSRAVEARLTELRDLMVGDRARALEAQRGTAKGIEHEDRVEEALRRIGRGMGGCVVERTGRQPGGLGVEATVGDFVVTFPTGQRVLIEAKDVARLGLAGKEGVLAELDRGMANRGAEFAICISAQDAFPDEVGAFGIYGNRLLLVDDGEGTLLSVAMRWAAAALGTAGVDRANLLDTGLLFDRLQRLRSLAQLFSTNRRALSDVKTSVDNVRGSLEGMRSELLALTDEVTSEIQRACRDEDAPQALVAG